MFSCCIWVLLNFVSVVSSIVWIGMLILMLRVLVL